MAEIKVAIKGDDSDIKAKFKESSEAARVFADHVKEQFGALKEMSADIAGESGFGAVKKVLTGLGGVAFGAMIVEQFKHATEAAIDWEKQVTALKFALPQAFSGMAEGIQEWVESVSGGMGSVVENMKVMQALLQSGMGVDEAKANLIDLQNAAMKLGVSVEDLGKSFAEMKARGEVPERFFKEFPALAPIARTLGGGEHPSVDFMLKTLLPSVAPGGLRAPVRIEAEQTAVAQLSRFGVELENVSQTLGVELLPSLKEWLKEFREAIPTIGKTAKEFGQDLAEAFQWIHKNAGWLFADIAANRYPGQRTIESVHDWMFSSAAPPMDMHSKLFTDSAVALRDSARAQAETAQAIQRAVNPHR